MERFDVTVVGARAAGAATAMLLARRGLRVLLLDRDRYGRDTLSTHALMRGAVLLLGRWRVLDRIVDKATPPIRRATFHYGGPVPETSTVSFKPALGVDSLYAPRRTVLDPALVDAAAEAGAEVRFGVTATGLIRDRAGRVTGVTGHDQQGTEFRVSCALTVGADGAKSMVARETGAQVIARGSASGAFIYGYWADLPIGGYEWSYRPGGSAGLIPTNDGRVCAFVGLPSHRFPAELADGLPAAYRRLLPALAWNFADRLAEATPPGRLWATPGRIGFARETSGPGWALVGDAGSFIDPISTHGITDALRDAALLANWFDDPSGYAGARDRIALPMLGLADAIARYDWDITQLRRYLLELSSRMSEEVELLASLRDDMAVAP
ncbi:MAG TPA: NAD(P)/FAD-dependent oxidoreductase [Micromonosporaceae bacterium]